MTKLARPCRLRQETSSDTDGSAASTFNHLVLKAAAADERWGQHSSGSRPGAGRNHRCLGYNCRRLGAVWLGRARSGLWADPAFRAQVRRDMVPRYGGANMVWLVKALPRSWLA